MSAVRFAILISGRGSNMEALIRAAETDPEFPAQPVLVIANRPDARGLEIADGLGVATALIDHKIFGKNRDLFEREIDRALTDHAIELVALAGFMRVLTPWFVSRWRDRLINIHPSLLPKYKGLNTHQRALDAGDEEAGSTVHWVSDGVDEGEIILQARVPILPGDDEPALAARVLQSEHTLYPEALKIAARKVRSDRQIERPEAR
jgi:phosphoribosylglycinamide formyltransferase 1